MEESRSAALVGRQLGQYEIHALIGEGGMGVVYEAEDLRLRRRVAIKILPEEMSADENRLKRFRREAKAIASLSHPNIVTLHSVEEADGYHFLTMELVEGETLARTVPPNGLPVDRAVEIGQALAGALVAAHDRGVLHRDLKPSNVMVDRSGWVKVLDFGLAKQRVEHEATWIGGAGSSLPVTEDGKILGTLSYMAPEQLRGLPADERSDVFSLGLVLFEMLTGTAPFVGENSAERIAAVLRDPPRPIAQLRADVPARVAAVVERCLQKDPERRFSSAAALRDELTAVRRELEISKLLESGALPQPPPPRSAWRTPAIAGGAVAFALLVVLGLNVFVRRQAEPSVAAGVSNRPTPRARRVAAEPNRPSIAVLPLRNFTGEPDYFVDGMTDGLIGALARAEGVRVISRQSAMHYKNSDKLLAQIAEELGVDYLLEGSVARENDQVLLQARLVRPDEEQLWAEALSRPTNAVLVMQGDVARQVVRAAGASVGATMEEAMSEQRAVDPSAYEAYLQGRHWARRFAEEDLRKAQGFFERSIALDSAFGPAWVGLAGALIRVGSYHLGTDATFGQAEAAALRALELDGSAAEAHVLLAEMEIKRWKWDAAEERLERALALDPSSSAAHRGYWILLTCQGRLTEAGKEIEAALRLNPLSGATIANAGFHRLLEERTAEAERLLLDALRLDPGYTQTHTYLWGLYHHLGKDPERGRELVEYLGAYGYGEVAEGVRERLAGDGYESSLQWAANELASEEGGKSSVKATVVAGLLSSAGYDDRALAWLESAYENHDWSVAWAGISPDYESLRDRPELAELRSRMGLEPLPRKEER